MVLTPGAKATPIECARDGCQWTPKTIPARIIANVLKNITTGLPKRTLSFSSISLLPFVGEMWLLGGDALRLPDAAGGTTTTRSAGVGIGRHGGAGAIRYFWEITFPHLRLLALL